MSVIQSIRDKYSKLMFFVLVLALVGFIFMYATNDVQGLFGKSTKIGTINGTDIDYKEYEAAIQQRENNMRQQNNGSLDENTQAQIRDQVWQEMVSNNLMAEVSDKLGLTVTESEVKDMIGGANPDPQIKQAFTDPATGTFDAQKALETVRQMERSKDPAQKASWDAFKASMMQQRVTSKFNSMVTGALYTPKAMLDAADIDRNTFASVKYVSLPYTLINDADVKISDDDIKKYMEAHKSSFEQKEASRAIEYVAFNVVPSVADSARVLGSLDTLKTAFAAASGDALETFLNRYSENQIPTRYQTAQSLQSLPSGMELMAAPVGAVVGPFPMGNGDYAIAKVESKSTFPDSVKVRHILVTTVDREGKTLLTDSAAKARIDSVVAFAKSGVSFDSLVSRYSDDPGKAQNGGTYDFSLAQKGDITEPFGDFAFGGKTGESKVVKVESKGQGQYSGYHYIEILRQGKPEATSKIAFVSKSLIPDQTTETNIYNAASNFANKTTTDPKSFEKNAQAAGVQKQTAWGLNENSFMVGQLGSSHELVKWAYSAKVGEVSPIVRMGDKYVIAKLTNIQQPGMLNITPDVRTALETYVKRDKKAQMLMDRSKGKTLDAIASAEGQTIMADDSVNLYNAKTAISQETKVLGYTFYKGFKENTLSPGIPGHTGVYYITVNSRTAGAATPNRNLNIEQQSSSTMAKSQAPQLVLNAMKLKADVKDKRGKLYN